MKRFIFFLAGLKLLLGFKKHQPQQVQITPLAHRELTSDERRWIVEDVTSNLSKSWRFRFTICVVVIGVLGTILGLITLVIGGRIIDANIAVAEGKLNLRIDELTRTHAAKLAEADGELEKVRQKIDHKIVEEFKAEKIQQTIQDTAQKATFDIIAGEVKPMTAEAQKRISSFEEFLATKTLEYTKTFAELKSKLDDLKKRNELTKMADRAIGLGSLADAKELYKLAKEKGDSDLKNAAIAEDKRVFMAYSAFSSSQGYDVVLPANSINPAKSLEDELTIEELSAYLKGSAPSSKHRAKAAILIEMKLNDNRTQRTFALAANLAELLSQEKDLEVLKFLKNAFQKTVHYFEFTSAPGADEELQWFKNHEQELKEKTNWNEN